MTLSIKNGFNAFYALWKEFQILNDLSIKHLIKLILYENDVKIKLKLKIIWKFKRRPA